MKPTWKNPISSHGRLRSRYYHLRKKAKYTALILGAAVFIFFTFQFFSQFLTTKAAPLADTNADLDQYVFFDGTNYTTSTTEANNATANDFTLASTTTTGSPAAYFGMNYKFDQLKFNIGTPGVGGAVAWEYWNGTAWTDLGATDNTSNFTQSGTVSFTPPADWVKNSIGHLKDISFISEGAWASLAVKNDGTVRAWGSDSNGQLGDGTYTSTSSNVPVQVVDSNDPTGYLTGVTTVTIDGYHSFAIKSDGTVYGWGEGADGQLGNGTNDNTNVPAQISNLTGITTIAGGSYHSLAIKSDGTVWAWGRGGFGQLGNGSNINSNVPVQVVDSNDPTGYLTGVTTVKGEGENYSLALKNDGTVWAWGINNFGQLGNGNTGTNSNVPVQVVDSNDPTGYLTGVTTIAGGAIYALALKNSDSIWAWGDNRFGQLGDGTYTSSNVPVQVVDPNDPTGYLTGVTAIEGGEEGKIIPLL